MSYNEKILQLTALGTTLIALTHVGIDAAYDAVTSIENGVPQLNPDHFTGPALIGSGVLGLINLVLFAGVLYKKAK